MSESAPTSSTPEAASASSAAEFESPVVAERPPMEPEKDILGLTPEEASVQSRMTQLQELGINTKLRVADIASQVDARIDTFHNKREGITRKVLLLEQRENAKQRKSTRLKAKLDKARPGSMRQRRLSSKYGKTNRKLKDVRATIGRFDNAPIERIKERENRKTARNNKIQLNIDQLSINKKVATEKKIRREFESDMLAATDTSEREWLKQEIDSWPDIKEFKKKLLREATGRYHRKVARP